jgi:hypothetical protein
LLNLSQRIGRIRENTKQARKVEEREWAVLKHEYIEEIWNSGTFQCPEKKDIDILKYKDIKGMVKVSRNAVHDGEDITDESDFEEISSDNEIRNAEEMKGMVLIERRCLKAIQRDQEDEE